MDGLKAFVRVGTLAALMGWTVAAPAAERELALTWSDPHGLFAQGFDGIGRELDGIFETLGVDLVWTKCSRLPTSAPSNGIQVLLVQSDPSDWDLSPMAMGAVFTQRSRQGEVYIFFRPVARAVGFDPDVLRKRWPTAREKRDLSRALSRVIAHEVMHAVLPGRPHADEGLTHFKLDRASLLTRQVHLDPDVAEAFRAALRPSAPRITETPVR